MTVQSKCGERHGFFIERFYNVGTGLESVISKKDRCAYCKEWITD